MLSFHMMCITLYIVGELGGKTKCKLQLGLTGRMHATMQHTYVLHQTSTGSADDNYSSCSSCDIIALVSNIGHNLPEYSMTGYACMLMAVTKVVESCNS